MNRSSVHDYELRMKDIFCTKPNWTWVVWSAPRKDILTVAENSGWSISQNEAELIRGCERSIQHSNLVFITLPSGGDINHYLSSVLLVNSQTTHHSLHPPTPRPWVWSPPSLYAHPLRPYYKVAQNLIKKIWPRLLGMLNTTFPLLIIFKRKISNYNIESVEENLLIHNGLFRSITSTFRIFRSSHEYFN